ncbi:hypothetical protein EDM80_07210 [bacterium]|nr:MAG: hypothetical protein EDM80_07210 [bacterium]
MRAKAKAKARKPRKLDGWGGAGKTLAQELAERHAWQRQLTREEVDKLIAQGERDCARLDRKKRKSA